MYFATVVCPTSIPSGSFYTLREAQIVIESWRRHYNTIRPHASIEAQGGMRTEVHEVEPIGKLRILSLLCVPKTSSVLIARS